MRTFLGAVAPQITVALPPPAIRVISPGPGWLTLLVTFLVGAATALAVQLVVQLYVVPKVETRKRREDRWERNVLELGDLLTTVLDRRAYEAKVEQGKFRDVRQLERELGRDQHNIAQSREQQARAAQQATTVFGDLLRTRVDLLIGRVRNVAPEAGAIVKFDSAARHYQVRTTFVRVRPQDDRRTETEFEEDWQKEYDARSALVTQMDLLAGMPHPPRASWRARGSRRRRSRAGTAGHASRNGPRATEGVPWSG